MPGDARLTEAADLLDHLYEGSKHIPTGLVAHAGDTRGRVSGPEGADSVAQFFYGGGAEVFVALGPQALPLLSALLRKTAAEDFSVPSEAVIAALRLAEHLRATIRPEETG